MIDPRRDLVGDGSLEAGLKLVRNVRQECRIDVVEESKDRAGVDLVAVHVMVVVRIGPVVVVTIAKGYAASVIGDETQLVRESRVGGPRQRVLLLSERI